MSKQKKTAVLRISIGQFNPGQIEGVEKMLKESETLLRPAIEKLPGNIFYYVAVDKEKSYMTNASLWKTLEDAQQMNTLKEMLDLRTTFEELGIKFMPITNHEVLWSLQK